ncbi:MAG: DUF5011 domain-containing protein [Bacteroidales bacterium]|nr:DUF5011 domain-containing protein [Bacteroidales bacterium]
MKNIIFLSVAILAIVFVSCDKQDTISPDVLLLGDGGAYLAAGDTDTTVLLFSKFTDPGFEAEDNLTKTEDLILVNDLEDVLLVNDAGYLRKTGEYTITYSATDEAGNKGTATRKITVENISAPFAGTYFTNRTAQQIAETTNYTSTVAVDTRIPGRLSFPKVYAHVDGGEDIYFKLYADLYKPEVSDEYSESIAYMGKPTDKEAPFFELMTYSEAIEEILSFERLMIPAQTFTDALGNAYTISGVADPANPDMPYSRIEYLGESTTITKIYLELNVTKDGVYTDRVTEIYTPQ